MRRRGPGQGHLEALTRLHVRVALLLDAISARPKEPVVPKSPYWCCTGWWSPWCVLDIVTRCHIRAICDRHDRSILGDPR